MANLTVARLRELLHYDPETGVFTRRVRTAQRHQVGDRADFPITTGVRAGYRRVAVDSARYHAHHAAWLYVHGEWPARFIDHRNTDRGDNRISNLREATHTLNMENVRKPRAGNRSGFLGVYRHQGKWYGRVSSKGRQVYGESFDTPEEAHQGYLKAKRIHHPGCTI